MIYFVTNVSLTKFYRPFYNIFHFNKKPYFMRISQNYTMSDIGAFLP
nr:MAG TPA: hypothetical protein [Bacteriophage sp.]